jgi:hypothetical protein
MTKKYIVYRSRFQPCFQDYNEKAIQLIDEKYGIKDLVLALVSDDLFDKDEQLNSLYPDPDYRVRFHDELQPEKSIGRIQTSIYDFYPDRQIRIFLSPNTILLSGVIYDSNPKNYPSIYRHFMHEKPEDIQWYFPIFDKDDLNDLGRVGMMMEKKYPSSVLPRDAFFFSRFNYHKNRQLVHRVGGIHYGAYAKSVSSNEIAQTRLGKAIDSLDGMTVPDVSDIPYIYVFSDLKIIIEKISNLLNIYKDVGAEKEKNLLNTQILLLSGVLDNLNHAEVKYAKKLIDFHAFVLNLIKKIEFDLKHSALYKLHEFNSYLKEIGKKSCEYNSVECFFRTDCEDCADYKSKNSNKNCCWSLDWLEDSSVARKRCDDFVKAIDVILSGLNI